MLARSLAQAAGSKASLLSWQPAAASQAALLDGSSQRAIEGALRSSSRAFSPAASVAVAAAAAQQHQVRAMRATTRGGEAQCNTGGCEALGPSTLTSSCTSSFMPSHAHPQAAVAAAAAAATGAAAEQAAAPAAAAAASSTALPAASSDGQQQPRRRGGRKRGGGGGGGGDASGGSGSGGSGAAQQLRINLTAQLERNLMRRDYARAAALFEEFVARGRRKAAGAAADKGQQQGQQQQQPQQQDSEQAHAAAAASPSAAAAAAAAAVAAPSTLPHRDYWPERRAFQLYYIALRGAALRERRWQGLAVARVDAAIALEAAMHAGAADGAASSSSSSGDSSSGSSNGGDSSASGGSSTSSSKARLGREAASARLAALASEGRHAEVLEAFEQLRRGGGSGGNGGGNGDSGGDGATFPHYRAAIEAALEEGKTRIAASLIRAVLDGACATTLLDRGDALEPLCGALARAAARRRDLPAAVEALRVRARLRGALAATGNFPSFADGALGSLDADPRRPAVFARRQARQRADVALYLELARLAMAAASHAPAALALLRMAAEQPVVIAVGGATLERPPVFQESEVAPLIRAAAKAASPAALEVAELAWAVIKRSQRERAEQAALHAAAAAANDRSLPAEAHVRAAAAPEAAGLKREARPPLLSTYQEAARAALRCGAYARAWEVAAEMLEAHGGERAPPRARSAFGGLAFFAEALDSEAKVHAAFSWIDARRAAGEPVPAPLMNVLLRAVARLKGSASAAARAFEMLPAYGVAADADSYNAVIEACAAAGQPAAAQGLVAHMERAGVQPDATTVELWLRACAAAGDLAAAGHVLWRKDLLWRARVDAEPLRRLLSRAVDAGDDATANRLRAALQHQAELHERWRARARAGGGGGGGGGGGDSSSGRAGRRGQQAGGDSGGGGSESDGGGDGSSDAEVDGTSSSRGSGGGGKQQAQGRAAISSSG